MQFALKILCSGYRCTTHTFSTTVNAIWLNGLRLTFFRRLYVHCCVNVSRWCDLSWSKQHLQFLCEIYVRNFGCAVRKSAKVYSQLEMYLMVNGLCWIRTIELHFMSFSWNIVLELQPNVYVIDVASIVRLSDLSSLKTFDLSFGVYVPVHVVTLSNFSASK